MFISISLRKQPILPFRCPNADSMTMRADESLNPKNCSFLLDSPFTNSFVKITTMGTQGLLKFIHVLDFSHQL